MRPTQQNRYCDSSSHIDNVFNGLLNRDAHVNGRDGRSSAMLANFTAENNAQRVNHGLSHRCALVFSNLCGSRGGPQCQASVSSVSASIRAHPPNIDTHSSPCSCDVWNAAAWQALSLSIATVDVRLERWISSPWHARGPALAGILQGGLMQLAAKSTPLGISTSHPRPSRCGLTSFEPPLAGPHAHARIIAATRLALLLTHSPSVFPRTLHLATQVNLFFLGEITETIYFEALSNFCRSFVQTTLETALQRQAHTDITKVAPSPSLEQCRTTM